MNIFMDKNINTLMPEEIQYFQCEKCSKEYKTKKYFIIHQNKCIGLNVLTCPKCMKIFSTYGNKSAHMKKNNCKPKEILLNSNYCSITITFNYIYLIKEREFIDNNKNIFKIGKTKQTSNKRFSAYPKGSILLFHMICNDCDKIEIILINKFNQLFIKKQEIGNEYFQGNHMKMIETIYNTILQETF
jgi:uncharacterized C2H2 Zn-finger protein